MSEQHIQINRIYSVNPCFIAGITVVEGSDADSTDKRCWLDLRLIPGDFEIQTELASHQDNEKILSQLLAAAECPPGWEKLWHPPAVTRWPSAEQKPLIREAQKEGRM